MIIYVLEKDGKQKTIIEKANKKYNISIDTEEMISNSDVKVIDNKKDITYYATYHNIHNEKIISFNYIIVERKGISYILPYVIE